MAHTAPSLPQLTADALAACPPTRLHVGFSGGHDSSVLLHVLAGLPQARERGLTAIHVDHGLHMQSARWAQHCRAACAALDVPITVVKVRVDHSAGNGPEAAAREARYTAFAAILGTDERLLLAHHRDDQAETFLLKALRGAGPSGLGGMRELRKLGRGWLWRPWLDVPRQMLRDYALEHGIECIDDPANADHANARSFLRQEILPRLGRHWPNAARALGASAAACRDASDYLAGEVERAMTQLRAATDASLDATDWRVLHVALRVPVLHAWLHAQALPAPTTAQRLELERQIEQAGVDRVPQVAWPGAQVRLWRGRMHAMPPLRAPPSDWHARWDGQALRLPDGGGVLRLDNDLGARIDPPLEVRLRRGGERLRPAGHAHHHELRDLFQDAGLPPWWRPYCPLLYRNGKLIAIADLSAGDEGGALFAKLGARPVWQRGSPRGD